MSSNQDENNSTNQKNSKKDQKTKEEQLIETIKNFKEENQKLEQENSNLKKLKPKNSDDLFPGVRTQETFKGGYRNGFEDGSVAQFQREHPIQKS